ncbi:hypothetical protein Fot_10902 [Forsythia ovata]|uniref:Uncharacterized protein n=1 Tax=Forsythia ovata TaxID=205694 RepID=A0ABD1WI54_9LAMI
MWCGLCLSNDAQYDKSDPSLTEPCLRGRRKASQLKHLWKSELKVSHSISNLWWKICNEIQENAWKMAARVNNKRVVRAQCPLHFQGKWPIQMSPKILLTDVFEEPP